MEDDVVKMKQTIHMLREAIALYYPSYLQPDHVNHRPDPDQIDNSRYASDYIELALVRAYEASAKFDPEPEHFLGFTIDHGQNVEQAKVMMLKVHEIANKL